MLVSRTLRIAAPIALAAVLIAGAVSIGRAGLVPHTAAAGDCTADPALDSEEQAFLQMINAYRAQNGLGALAPSWTLSKAAQWKSQDMGANNYFAHDDLTRGWVDRLRDCGYTYNAWLGENIAAGNSSAAATFDQWKNSPGHNANMLNANYTAIGIGRAYVSGGFGWYWSTDFGSVSDGWQGGASTPTSTAVPPTHTPTRTPTRTATAAATPTRTATPVATPTRTAAPVATPTAAAPAAGVHLGNINGAIAGSRAWRAQVAVWVHDANDRPVRGATVSGRWNGWSNGTCVTNASGYCTLSSPRYSTSSRYTIFYVTDVRSSAGAYVSARNHDDDGSSTGTAMALWH